MVDYVGFSRSKELSPCKEFATLSTLKMARAIHQTRKQEREVAFGAIMTGEEARVSEFRTGRRTQIDIQTIKNVQNDLLKMAPQSEEYDMCLFHTHPGGAVRPSISDAKSIISSLDSSNIGMLDRKEFPTFDCFYIATQRGMEGKLKGWIIEERPSRAEYSKIAKRALFADDNNAKTTEEKAKIAQAIVEAGKEYIRTCETRFDAKIKELRET
jgi:proteasome lid subunit RPN8/RPN11